MFSKSYIFPPKKPILVTLRFRRNFLEDMCVPKPNKAGKFEVWWFKVDLAIANAVLVVTIYSLDSRPKPEIKKLVFAKDLPYLIQLLFSHV